MGTGSGCVAVALALRLPDRMVDASDISEEALAVARRNVARHGCQDRVTCWRGSLWEALPKGKRYAGVIANLPYLPTGVIPGLDPEVLAEPRVALDGGPDGLTLIRPCVAHLPARLVPGALMGLEVGWDQAETVAQWVQVAGMTRVEIAKDLQGHDRYVFAERP